MVRRQNAHTRSELRRLVEDDLLARDLASIAAAAGTTVAELRQRIEREHGEAGLDSTHRLSVIHRAVEACLGDMTVSVEINRKPVRLVFR